MEEKAHSILNTDSRLAIFDIDGTLLDPAQGMYSAVQYTTNAFGLPPVTDAAFRTFIGPPIQNSFRHYYNVDEMTAADMAAMFRARYKQVDLFHATLYPGVYEMLAALCACGVCIAVATYKREDYVGTLLSHFGLDRYVKIWHGSDFAGKMQKRDIIRLCLAEAAVPAERAVMVGDTASDAEGAAAAGIAFIGVTYGYGFARSEEVLALGGYPCANAAEVLEYLSCC